MNLSFIEINWFNKSNNFREITRYKFSKNYCDMIITGKEEICDKIYDIINKIEFEPFGKDQKEVPVINDYSNGIDETFSINIYGARENVKKYLDILKSNSEYQALINKRKK